VFEGVSEAQAEFAPEGEWSAKENLAHLVLGEEWNLHWYGQFLSDNEPQWGDAGENRREQLRAVLTGRPSVQGLIDRLARAQEETSSLIEASADVLGARRGVMWRLGMFHLHFPGDHERGHIAQIRKTLEAARAAEPAAQPG